MAAELQVMIDAQVTGLGTDTDVRSKKIDAETPTNVIKMKPIVSTTVALSTQINLGVSLWTGIYVRSMTGVVYAAVVSTIAEVSLNGARLEEGEAMYMPVSSGVVATKLFALNGSTATTQAEVMIGIRTT